MKFVTVLVTVLSLSLAACGTPSSPATEGSPAASAPTSDGASTTPMSSPSDPASLEPSPAATPTPAQEQALPLGVIATVVADELNIRTWPGLIHDIAAYAHTGDELVLTLGPIEVAGFQWYEARFDARQGTLEDGVTYGWVASGPVDDDEAFLALGQPACPDELDLAELTRLTPLAVEACAAEVSSVEGVVDTCYEGPLTPYIYEPEWLWFSCWYVHDNDGDQEWFPIHFPPDYAGPDVERGDVVILTGHLGFDEDRYGACTVQSQSGEDAPQVGEAEAQMWPLTCQSRFVVTGAEVTGHVELPPLP